MRAAAIRHFVPSRRFMLVPLTALTLTTSYLMAPVPAAAAPALGPSESVVATATAAPDASVLAQTPCQRTRRDIDGDCIRNGRDRDVDGDGIRNGRDRDVDGDGIPNRRDHDSDGDRIPNRRDHTPNGVGGSRRR
jgi:hypothetical protein